MIQVLSSMHGPFFPLDRLQCCCYGLTKPLTATLFVNMIMEKLWMIDDSSWITLCFYVNLKCCKIIELDTLERFLVNLIVTWIICSWMMISKLAQNLTWVLFYDEWIVNQLENIIDKCTYTRKIWNICNSVEKKSFIIVPIFHHCIGLFWGFL